METLSAPRISSTSWLLVACQVVDSELYTLLCLTASVHLWLQLCTEEIWQGTMEQITKLGIQPAELPEEALTQIYQVTDACLQS